LPGSDEAKDLGTVSDSDVAAAEQIQKTQSIETVGTVVTETATRTEKILPDTNPEEQYKFAVSFIKIGDYETAELALREFVDNNEKHQLAGNAQYWYGETFRVRQLYQDAATAYLDGYQKYPKSTKAPVNLLKLGVMLVQIGEKEQGCSMILGVKDQYPKANQSVIQKAEYEKKKFNCEKKS
jgi:tol-pal system protein YbgF